MPATLSIDAARRQSFGAMFNQLGKDPQLAGELLAGRLRLNPHPLWTFDGAVDWSANPFSDKNWRSQLHMLRWMDPLRRRAEKGDDASAEAWLHIAEDWVRRNPPPPRAPEWRGAWTDMVDGIRALELCVAVPFVAEHRPQALEWLGRSIREHGDWLMDAAHLGHSNHALHQHQGLLVCGAVLQDAQMQDIAEKRMVDLFSDAYDDQGINAEGALMYHLANYTWWSVARRRLEAEGRPIPARMVLLDEVPIELAHATKPDGRFASIGDTDGGSARLIQHPATRWASTAGADGEPPEDLVKIYDAGYLFARSGWGDHERDFSEETFFSVSFGAANRVHGHVDGGSMTFSSMGQEWITDPGKFQYGQSEMRDYCLERSSHSLPAVADRKYSRSSVVTLESRRTDDQLVDVSFRDDGYKGVTLTRRIVYSMSGEYAVVIDKVAADSPCTVVQNWQCGSGVVAEQARNGYRLSSGERRAAVLCTGIQPEMSIAVGEESPLAGWVATGWKQREAAPALRFQKTGTRFRFVTLLAAGFRGELPTLETVKDSPAGELRLKVNTGRVAEQIVITAQDAALAPYSQGAAEPESSRPPRTGARALDPLNSAIRRRINQATSQARRAAWESSRSPEILAELAEQLVDVQQEFDIRNGMDLGLQSALNDLRAVSHAERKRLDVERDRPGLISWEDGRAFRPTRLSVPTRTVFGTVGALPTLAEDTLLTYILGPLVLPALVIPAPGNTLTVMFHGAVDRARTNLPLFQRTTFQRTLRAGPVVAFADPTLDLARELRLGWYLGNDEVDLHHSMANAIKALAPALGASNIVLQGGSGGGLAALQVGSRIDGAHVMAANPQTDIRRYPARFAKRAFELALGVSSIETESSSVTRVSVIEQLLRTSPSMEVTLVMNKGDLFHEREHAVPLREAIATLPNMTLHDVIFDLGPGHKGMDNSQYEQVMRGVYDRLS